jgi:hypothetical protein
MTSAAPHTPQKPLALANLSEPTYRVADGWLERDGRQILAGPTATLEQFADMLNLLNPPRRVLPDVLRACIQMTRGCHFTPGEELRRIGRGVAA